MVYLTNSSMQSTSRSLLPLGISLLPASSSVNCLYAMGMELWFGMTNMRIHRPSIRRALTVLKDCDPPFTCAIPRVRPWVGRTEPVDSGIQSIWFLKTAVYKRAAISMTLNKYVVCWGANLRGSHAAQDISIYAHRSTYSILVTLALWDVCVVHRP